MRRITSPQKLLAGIVSLSIVIAAATAKPDRLSAPERASGRPQLMVQLGHHGPVTSVAFSPDGKQVLTGGDTVRLWDATSAEEIRKFDFHTDGRTAIAVSPDGKHVLTASGGAELWDMASGKQITQMFGQQMRPLFAGTHGNSINSVAFSPDGVRALTGSDDQTARVWDLITGEEIQKFTGHTLGVTSVAFSPDGKQVLTGSADQTARLWEVSSGNQIQEFDGHTSFVLSVAFSPDGKQVLTGSADNTARLWDAKSGKEIRKFEGHTFNVVSVAFSPDGKQVLTGGDSTARLWEVDNGKEIRKFDAHTMFVTSVAFSPDGKQVLTGNDDSRARLWDAKDGKEIRRFEGHVDEVPSAAVSPDGKQVLIGSSDHTARQWDATTGREIRKFDCRSGGVVSIAFSPDGKKMLTATSDGTARLWDAATGKEIRELGSEARNIKCAALSPDGKQVLTGGDDQVARLWDVASGSEIRRFEGHTNAILSVAFSPDGKQVLTASSDTTARLWNVARGEQIREFKAPFGGPVFSASFSPDGKQVLVTTNDGTPRLWDAASGEILRKFLGAGDMFSAAFSPDGSQIVTGGGLVFASDNAARLWDVASGKEIRSFEGHAGQVLAIAFSPDGKRLITANADGTTILWNVSTGEELCSLVSFTDGDWAVVDSEGRFDASGGGDVAGLHWVVGNEPIELLQLKKRYYDPGLLAKKLGFNHEPLRNVGDFISPKFFPAVQLIPSQNDPAKFDIQLANRNGGIGPVVVKINGKELSGDARGDTVSPHAASATIPINLTNDPRLKPGEDNKIEVYAFDADENWHSRGQRFSYVDPRPKPVEKPNIWAVVIGVSHYQNGVPGKPDLRYPAKDAADFATGLGVAVSDWVGEDNFHLTLLTSPLPTDPQPADSQGDAHRPNRQNILAALQALQDYNRVKSTDILVLYLAGHGVGRGGSDSHFYFPTCDCDADNIDLADEQIRRQWAVSDQELTDAITKIPALKQVMILDTCHAGTLIDDLTKKRDTPSQIRSWEEDKDRTGLHILAGCAADSVSYEASRYGQGVLTYSLLFGMRGGALDAEHFVDVSTLFKFSVHEVPQLALGIGGVQEPVVASPKGETFCVGQIAPADEQKIPLQALRPLVLRANFHDENELDPLNLTDQTDESLHDASARGKNPPLEFVDANKMPDAYHVAGAYHVDGADVTVTVRLNPVDQLGVAFKVTGKTTNVAALAAKITQELESRLPPPQPAR